MSAMKAVFAMLVLTASAGLTPSAFAAAAQPVFVASGSSAMWQTMGLAAYNQGQCPVPRAGITCSHYTDNAKFELHDTRPGRKQKNSPDAIDTGDLWIVWDNSSPPNVWTYVKVDSIVGDRCFFANPKCNIVAPTGYNWSVVGNKIPVSLWGVDVVPPCSVQALFGTFPQAASATQSV
jgi:hypothetical protein